MWMGTRQMQTRLKLCLVALLYMAMTNGLLAQYVLETKDLRLVYLSQSQKPLAQHAARCFENSLAFHSNLFNYKPKEKVTVLLHDFSDYGNAGAKAIPEDFVYISIAPFSYVYETTPANDRMNWIMNHELVHIVASDKETASDNTFRSLFFGKVAAIEENPISMLYSYLTNPRDYSPRWYHEGAAVFMETWMAGGLGRAQGAYDEMVFRTLIRDKSHIYDLVGLESEAKNIDFQAGVVSYLYGTRFMTYLSLQYGPGKLIDWVSRSQKSKAYFASQFKQVYGKPLDKEWSEWIAWETRFQQSNLDSIRNYPTTEFHALSRRALGSVSRFFYDAQKRKLYAAINYPGQVSHIAAIDVDSGEIDKISDIKGAALFYTSSLAFDPASNRLFFTADNNQWRDLMAVDINTGKKTMLLKDARVGDLAFNQADKSIWGIRHDAGISTLVRIPYPYNEWNQIHSWPYGQDMYDIDVSPDGRFVTGALADVSGRQRLIKMNVENVIESDGSSAFDVLFDFENSIPSNFVFSPDGRFLYGSSYYSGVSNIYRYDFAGGEMEALSNCETGFFRPLPISDDSLIVLQYTGKGFVPGMISNKPVEHVGAIKFLGNEVVQRHPIVKEWLAPSPASVNIDSLTLYAGKYNALKNIKLSSAYPIVEGFKDFAAVGMRFDVAGPLGLNKFDLTVSYTPDGRLSSGQRTHLNFNYSHLNWRMHAAYNAADFYDLFGPTKTSRKGYSVGLQYKKTLLYDLPRTMDYAIHVAGYGNLETLPDFQNVASSFDKFLTASASFNYKYLRTSLGAVDYEKGFSWQIVSGNNYVNKKLFPRIYSSFDYGFALPINHSSIWFRSSAGVSFGDRGDPFANFFFGGFGNNRVDHLRDKRYREYYSFPGVDLNEIGGKNYGKLLVEWNLPPIRFRRLGFPSFYSSWARVSLFSTGIVTDVDRQASRRKLANVGGQVDFRLIFLSNIPLTLSFGYATAFEKNENRSDEFMFSLKIL